MLRVRTTLSGFPGGPGLMTNYFDMAGQEVADAVRARQRVHDLIGTALGLVFSNQVTWKVQEQVDVLTAATGQITTTLVDSSPHTNTGGGGIDMAPAASAGLIRWGTSSYLAGRRVQGRSFINPMASAKVNGSGNLTGTCYSAVNAALVTWLGAFGAGDVPVVWHRPKLGLGGTICPITSATVQEKLAVLTSRRD